METETTSESEENATKTVTSVRMSPALKKRLTDEARRCGMSTSEYCDLILHNREESAPLHHRIIQLEAEIGALRKTLEESQATTQRQIAANSQLTAELSHWKNQAEIFKDPRLQFLFGKLRGKSDKVENAYGDDFEIIYDSPQKVLIALIYSTKLNK